MHLRILPSASTAGVATSAADMRLPLHRYGRTEILEALPLAVTGAAPRFGELAQAALDGVQRLVLDLDGLVSLDASSLAVLVGLVRRVLAQGGAVRACGASPALRSLLDMARLGSCLRFCVTRGRALRELDGLDLAESTSQEVAA